jgi:hypothetical protein
VPISNVSASSRHIYVPPCRPLLRPTSWSFHAGGASLPPLSCIHGFGQNLLFSTADPVRILYADLVDIRHVCHSLIDLASKMKQWKKKLNAASADKKGAANAAGSAAARKADGLPLPPPPASLLSPPKQLLSNPNIGIEFHLNDANPHVLARSVLFLVAAYSASACMNQATSMQTAIQFGIPVPQPSTQQQNSGGTGTASAIGSSLHHVSSAAARASISSASAAASLSLASYRHWSPSEHWLYLFFLYGNYAMPLQFLSRTTETLQLLVRLAGGRLVREEADASQGGLLSPPTAVDSSFFSSHPYTFFLQLPSLVLAGLLPIWKNWEDMCARACGAGVAAIVAASSAANAAKNRNGTAASTSSSSSPSAPSSISATAHSVLPSAASSLQPASAFVLPPVEQPVFPPSDVLAAHPGEPDLVSQINHFYKHGCALVDAKTFPGSKAREEIECVHAAALAAQASEAAPSSSSSSSSLSSSSSNAVAASRVHELYPPSTEEYADRSSYLLNPTVFPYNFSASNPLLGGNGVTALGAPTTAQHHLLHSGPSPPVVAANILAEVSQKHCYAREPFSLLLARLASGTASTPASSGKDKKEDKPAAGATEVGGKEKDGSSTSATGLLGAALDVMSKTSHALFWLVQFQQSAAAAAAGASKSAGSAAAPAVAPSTPRSPYVRLYLYQHDVCFHLHTYDFLYDRILLLHQPDYTGLQAVLLLARARMKSADSVLECTMNFPSCLPVAPAASSPSPPSSSTALTPAQQQSLLPDLHKFCLLSLNANPKLLRNIFGWDLSLYTYPTPAGFSALRATTVLRLSTCEFNVDLSAPTGHPSDGLRVVNDWFMTAIQPILLHEEFQSIEAGHMDVLRASTPRSHVNLRTFCMLIGLLIKQGHLDQLHVRHRLITLFSTLLAPRSPYQMDHLFTSLLTHIGLLKSELLPLIFLLLCPLEDTLPTSPVMAHNALFFKGLWQLDFVSMKFESLLHAGSAQLAAARQVANHTVSHSYVSGAALGTKAAKLAQQNKISKGKEAPLPEFDPACRLCQLAGPNHLHHQQHAAPGGGGVSSSAAREPLLSLLFVTIPSACPTPISSAPSEKVKLGPTFHNGGAPMGTAAGPVSKPPPPPPASVAQALQPGSVPADSPLAWVNHRDVALLRWLRECGRGAQSTSIGPPVW